MMQAGKFRKWGAAPPEGAVEYLRAYYNAQMGGLDTDTPEVSDMRFDRLDAENGEFVSPFEGELPYPRATNPCFVTPLGRVALREVRAFHEEWSNRLSDE